MDWYVIGEKTYLSYGKPFLCVLLIMITINQSMNSFLYQNIIVQVFLLKKWYSLFNINHLY